MPPPPPVPASNPLALSGRVVTMDATNSVKDDAVVYVAGGRIADIRAIGQPPPAGFEQVAVVKSGGTIYPGMVELHNHLPYDVLSLWNVPRPYGNRDQWSGPGNPDYRRLITGPMQVLGAQADVTAAVVRYAEMRCLLGGTTTSQGITLAKSSSIVTHFRGLVRNVEKTDDPLLPAALTHIADVEAAQRDKFLKRLAGKKKLILHLAEGVDESAHKHFASLQDTSTGTWAINHNLIGIHCVALKEPDFAVLEGHGGSMVWSPLSNLLLYGQTADIAAALRQKVPIALGSDWAPSGSKNLLGELKVARMVAASANLPLSSADLVAMVTKTPAAMIGWGAQVGTVAKDFRADLVVVTGTTADPYRALLDATEADLRLVMIEGAPRVGVPAMLTALGATATEAIKVGGQARALDLTEVAADTSVGRVSMAEATAILTTALANLPNAAKASKLSQLPRGQVRLAVEGLVDNRKSSRPHLPYHGHHTGPNYRSAQQPRLLVRPLPKRPRGELAAARTAGATAPVALPALTLDPVTAVDNPGYYEELAHEINLDDPLKAALLALRPT